MTKRPSHKILNEMLATRGVIITEGDDFRTYQCNLPFMAKLSSEQLSKTIDLLTLSINRNDGVNRCNGLEYVVQFDLNGGSEPQREEFLTTEIENFNSQDKVQSDINQGKWMRENTIEGKIIAYAENKRRECDEMNRNGLNSLKKISKVGSYSGFLTGVFLSYPYFSEFGEKLQVTFENHNLVRDLGLQLTSLGVGFGVPLLMGTIGAYAIPKVLGASSRFSRNYKKRKSLMRGYNKLIANLSNSFDKKWSEIESSDRLDNLGSETVFTLRAR